MMPSKIIVIMIENQFNPDPDAAVPTQELTEEQEQDSKVFYIEEWQKLLIERYQTLKDTVFESMPVLWNSIELILSIKPILHIKDITLPLIMILLEHQVLQRQLDLLPYEIHL